jgi:hypothetical protein
VKRALGGSGSSNGRRQVVQEAAADEAAAEREGSGRIKVEEVRQVTRLTRMEPAESPRAPRPCTVVPDPHRCGGEWHDTSEAPSLKTSSSSSSSFRV